MSRHDLLNPRPDDWNAETDARAILDAAIAEHDPSQVFALFSGGRDSWCAARIAADHPRFSGVVFINTGTGADAAVNYVRMVAPGFGGAFHELRSPYGHWFEQIVAEHGFPGPGQHMRVYVRLKERALDAFIREQKQHGRDRIALITGVREAESTRRMGSVVPVRRDGCSVWVAPLISWEERDKIAFMAKHCAPINPCWESLGRSGECNCGSFAAPGEEKTLVSACPDMADRIERWKGLAHLNGKPSVWGQAPASEWAGDDPLQMGLFLCDSCEFKALNREIAERVA